jgi:hypothetical protein
MAAMSMTSMNPPIVFIDGDEGEKRRGHDRGVFLKNLNGVAISNFGLLLLVPLLTPLSFPSSFVLFVDLLPFPHVKLMPTRLLEIGQSGSVNLYFHPSHGTIYTTLSYCWRKAPVTKLTTESLKPFKME